jgi:tubulin--tyrosine ligase
MGFDFMLDEDLNLTLIEVNTNPCLETPCFLLQRLIPQLLDQTLKLAVDPFLTVSQ